MSTRYAEEDLRKLEEHFSPLQQSILKILGDGKPHLKVDIYRSTTTCSQPAFTIVLSRLRRRLHKVAPKVRLVTIPHDDEVVLQLVRILPCTLADL